MNSLYRAGSLGAILLQSQIITEKDIRTALAEQKKSGLRFGETLVSLGTVRQEDIDWALSHQLDIPYVRINKETVDPAVLRLVPAAVARQHNLFPIVQIGNELRIAIADPLNREAIAAVEQVSGCSVAISMSLLREIREMQDYFYGDTGEMESPGFSSSCFSEEIIQSVNSDLSGATLLKTLLDFLLREGLAAIACKPLRKTVRVCGRKGALSVDLGAVSSVQYESFLGTVRELAGIAGGGAEAAPGSFNFEAATGQVQIQVDVMTAGRWEYVTLRPLFTASSPETMAIPEMTARDSDIVQRLATAPAGLVLFSSSRAEERVRLMGTCLHEHCAPGKDLLLIGRGFSVHADITPVLPIARHDPEMSRWIRASLNHDADIIAVEELVDTPAFTAAFEAVLGGKLLFGGVAAEGINSLFKLVLFYRQRLPMLSLYLRGAVACREVRLLCPVCKEMDPDPSSCPPCDGETHRPVFRAKGCPVCRHTGFSGKRLLVETAVFEQEFTQIFDRAETAGEMMAYLRQHGFLSMAEKARDLLHAGEISVDEYIAVTVGNGAGPWRE